MRCDDVCFADDPRLSCFQYPSRAGIVIRQSKTGPNQFFRLSQSAIVDKLHGWLHARGYFYIQNPLFGHTYGQLDRTFKNTPAELGLGETGYSLHSLRHGGATHEWLTGASLLYIMERGRWRSEHTVKWYLNSQRAFLVRVSMSVTQRDNIRVLSTRWYRIIGEGGSCCAA